MRENLTNNTTPVLLITYNLRQRLKNKIPQNNFKTFSTEIGMYYLAAMGISAVDEGAVHSASTLLNHTCLQFAQSILLQIWDAVRRQFVLFWGIRCEHKSPFTPLGRNEANHVLHFRIEFLQGDLKNLALKKE